MYLAGFDGADDLCVDAALIHPKLSTTCRRSDHRTLFRNHGYNVGGAVNEEIRCDAKWKRIIADRVFAKAVEDLLLILVGEPVAGEFALGILGVDEKILHEPLQL